MSSTALREILARAKQVRGGDRSKGAWKRAVMQAGQEYRAAHPNPNRKPRTASVASRVKGDERLDALYRGYKQELRGLKMRYWDAGLQIRSTQPRKVATRSGAPARKRLPPIIL